MKSRVRELSKGMIAQLHLALVMAIDAKLLVLDEPTLGLDVLYRKDFYQTLLNDYFDHERTIIVTTHQVEEVENLLTDVMFINRGKVVLDTPVEEIGARAAEVARLRASFRLVPSTAPDEHEAPRAVAPPAPVVFEGDQLCELRGFTAAVALARLLRPELTPQALAAAGRVRQPGWSRTVTVATAETVIAWAEHECPELQHGPARSG